MGTNYYLEFNTCPCCGEKKAPLHIGKSSAGWCFSLRVYPEKGIKNLNDWLDLWNEFEFTWTKIKDEYGTVISKTDMIDTIVNRSFPEGVGRNFPPFGYTSWKQFYQANSAVPGPNNLMRHKIDGSHCIGHGEGTWDYIIGEFS